MASEDSLTTAEYAVLGFLSYGELSGYDLSRAAARTLGYTWAPSRSQIYKVLPRLVRSGLAESREVEQQGRPDKALYRLTDRGLETLRIWVEQVEEQPAGGVDVFWLKLLLGRVAPPEVAQAQLDAYRRLTEARLTELEEMERNLAPDVGVHTEIALRHGLIRARATLEWADEAQAALEKARVSSRRRRRKAP